MSHSLLNLFETTIPKQLIEHTGWILFHSLWQFLLLAFLAVLMMQRMQTQSASRRYVALSSILLGMMITPMATWFAVSVWHPADGRQGRTGAILDEESANARLGSDPYDATSNPIRNGLAKKELPSLSKAESRKETVESGRGVSLASGVNWIRLDPWISQIASCIQPWLSTSVIAWILGVVVFSMRPILSWWTIGRLRTDGVSDVDDSILELLSKLKRTLHLKRNVSVVQSSLVRTPIVVGVLRSVILLPISLIANLPPAQIEAILAHELAHVKRYDFLVNILQAVVETLFFYHPAIWWLSRRIRIEREHCCDDLVVETLGNRVDYGKALLAVEEHLGIASTLALGASDGSLLSRVQRIAGLATVGNESRVKGLVATLSSGMLVSGMTLLIISTLSANGDERMAPFGKESNGLQFRIIPLSSNVDDKTPDLLNKASTFKRSTDMTFAVELKNVGRESITLAGVRYGDGYAEESRGTLNTARLAPHWFDFEFTDKDGKPFQRTHREFYDGWHITDSSSTHLLKPGESLIEILRPAKFLSPMDFDLLPGKYQVRVRYHGPSDNFREKVRKHWPDKPILKAWPHEVVSNVAEFAIEEISNRAKAEDLVWGKPVDGLQAAIEYRLPPDVTGNPYVAPGVPVGLPLRVTFHLRNASDKPISLISETGRQGDRIHVIDESGKTVEIQDTFYTGWPTDVAWRLLPGEMAQLDLLTPGVQSLNRPGKYMVRYTVRFNSRIQRDDAGNIIFPRPGDYDKEVDTGDTPLILHEIKKEVSP